MWRCSNDIPYLTEVSPSSMRGRLTSAYELMTSFGVLLAFLCGWLLCGGATNDAFGWRAAYLIPVALSIIQSISMLFMPESPKWLIENRLIREARNSLHEMYGAAEFEDLVKSCKIQLVEMKATIESRSVRSPISDSEILLDEEASLPGTEMDMVGVSATLPLFTSRL